MTDPGTGNKLDVKVTYDPEDKTFKNKYEAEGKLELLARKVLEGKDLEEGQFTFVLEEEDASGARTKIDEQKNDADGLVTFNTIEYTLKDLDRSPIKYHVREVVETPLHNYTYDETDYEAGDIAQAYGRSMQGLTDREDTFDLCLDIHRDAVPAELLQRLQAYSEHRVVSFSGREGERA